MGYEQALEAAGAKVIAFEEFGSYQGDWYALVGYNGEIGWVNGSYGSCSACDAFEGEFGFRGYSGGDGFWDYETDQYRAPTDAERAAYQTKLADFGKTYLDGMMTQEQAEQAVSQYTEWDSEATAMLSFIRKNGTLRS
ncbi:hypothetical protein CUB19_gp38c [Stenotrophomonas phage CUB19]|nr:hypothetical protein CUB19_gp38c [Stenotrophomonas phage CUB19]